MILAVDDAPAEEIAPIQRPSEPARRKKSRSRLAPPVAAPDAALLDREIKPVGPSIWEVFGIAPPNGEQPPAADAALTPPKPRRTAHPGPGGSLPVPRRSARRKLGIKVRAFERAQGLRLRLNQAQARRLHHRIKKTGP